MGREQQRYEMSDAVWEMLKQHLPRVRGGEAEIRRFVNGVFWVLRTGRPWRELPPCYGRWSAVYKRFREWREKGVWEKFLAILVDHPDFNWLIVEVDCGKLNLHPGEERGGSRGKRGTGEKRGQRLSLPWVKMVCRSDYLFQRMPELIAERLVM